MNFKNSKRKIRKRKKSNYENSSHEIHELDHIMEEIKSDPDLSEKDKQEVKLKILIKKASCCRPLEIGQFLKALKELKNNSYINDNEEEKAKIVISKRTDSPDDILLELKNEKGLVGYWAQDTKREKEQSSKEIKIV